MRTLILLYALLVAGGAYAQPKNNKTTGENPYKGYTTTPSGLTYKFHKQNKGTKAIIGQIVITDLVGKTEGDSVLFDSYKGGRPFNIPVSEPPFEGSLEEGLMMLTPGDSVTFLVSADSFYTKMYHSHLPDFIAPGGKLIFTLKVRNVVSQDDLQKMMQAEADSLQKKELNDIRKYVSDNKLDIRYTSSGLGFAIEKTSQGAQPASGDKVTVHYVGRLLNGKVFDSSVGRNVPFEFVIGTGGVIPGWDEGVAMMRVGEKFRLVIPSKLGYGERGAGEDIGPYSPLIFEVELLKIN